MALNLISQKNTVWCGLHVDADIEVYFFRDDQERHNSVNSNCYRSMITEYFWPQVDNIDLEEMWFQLDGAKSHTTNVTINLQQIKFGKRVVARNGPGDSSPQAR